MTNILAQAMLGYLVHEQGWTLCGAIDFIAELAAKGIPSPN